MTAIATSSASSLWAHRVQEGTLLDATQRNQRWTREALEYVVTHTDTESDEELAFATGRTLYAIWAVQHRIATGDLTMESIAIEFATPAAPATCPRCWTVPAASGDCLC